MCKDLFPRLTRIPLRSQANSARTSRTYSSRTLHQSLLNLACHRQLQQSTGSHPGLWILLVDSVRISQIYLQASSSCPHSYLISNVSLSRLRFVVSNQNVVACAAESSVTNPIAQIRLCSTINISGLRKGIAASECLDHSDEFIPVPRRAPKLSCLTLTFGRLRLCALHSTFSVRPEMISKLALKS